MDISKFRNEEGIIPTETYNRLYNEYKEKCDKIIPLGEKYVLNKGGTIGDVTLAEGSTFVIELAYTFAYTPHVNRIDLVVSFENGQCVVFDDIDELLSVLKTLDFSVYKKELLEKLEFLREETIKLFRMMQANDVELLIDVKNIFRKLENHAENADYLVKIKDR
jgi:hypothetical protein